MKLFLMVAADDLGIGGAESHLRSLKKAIAVTGNTWFVASHDDIHRKIRMAYEVFSRRFARQRWLVFTSLIEITHGIFAARAATRENVNVVNVHYPACFPAAFWIGRLIDIPVVLTVHSPFAEGLYETRQFPPASAGHRLARFLEVYAYRKADLVVTVSSFLRRYVHERAGATSARVTVQHNCVDTDEFRPRNRGEAIQVLKSSGYAIEAADDGRLRIVLSASRLIPIKGVRYLLEAAKIVKSTGEVDVHFFVAGEGRELPELLALRASLGMDESVTFLGAVPPRLMKYLYNLADVFVVPSISLHRVQEGFPIGVLEAMASCVPVVCTNTGGLVEIVGNGETGYIVPEKSPEAIAARITMILGQDQSRIIAQARALVEKEYSIKAFAGSLGGLLADVLSSTH